MKNSEVETLPVLDHGHTYCQKSKTLFSCSNGGLFSNFYHTVWSLVDLKNAGVIPQKIDFSAGFELFRGHQEQNVYDCFFQIDPVAIERWEDFDVVQGRLPRIDHHGVYRIYPYSMLECLMSAYFTCNEEVRSLISELKLKYNLVPGEYTSLYYRGTDKSTEVTLPSLESMIAEVKKQQHISNISRLLIQTDDAEIQSQLLREFADAIVIEELPVTSGNQGFHYKNNNQQLVDPLVFSQRLIAMTSILAQSSQLVLPTSNLAGWVCLIRGGAQGVSQFNKHGRLIDNVYLNFFRMKNVIRRARSRVRRDPYVYI